MSVSSSSLSLPGLSGYDFSSIVDTLVTSYSQPITQMQTQKTALETKKGAWQDVNTRLSSLENTLSKLQSAATWNGTTASSSNTALLTAAGSSGAVQGTYSIQVMQAAVAQTAVSEVQTVTDSSAATTLVAGSFKITVGEDTADITVAAGASLNDIADAINQTQVGVSASVIQVEGGYRLAVMSKETGVDNAASFTETSGTVLHQLGIIKSDDALNVSLEAKDALLTINGITNIKSASNSVTTAIPGVTLNINSEDPAKTVTVKVTADYSGAQAAVQAFVDQYNSVMSFIDTKISYNETTKAKGDLYADPALQAIQSRLRTMVSNQVNNPTGPYKILADIGVATSADDYGKSAALTLDADKFTKAMKENANSVANLFGAEAGGVTPVKESSGTAQAQGLANIMTEYLHPMLMYGGTMDKTKGTYDDQIKDVKKQIEDFTVKIAAYQEKTKLRFAKLETQLAGIGSQSAWLSSMVNSLSTNNEDK
ncbi:flagellar filament capping protein FliD [Dehalobacter sp. DCM]|uniref:flagellar filament capping protein FliD n=1 Tax=Dehalobacter sp. DCM TaxID=2907827 RepID=UPI003081B6C9|nr:flagellar filament capping protein FliD [Dehalobacter sp. DCM]